MGVGEQRSDFVERLIHAGMGGTFKFYRDGARAPLLAARLDRYLAERAGATLLLVAEAPGYRGARVSGIPLTSERQLTGEGPAEATASIVHAALRELGLAEDVMLWNVVPTHPGSVSSNRRPTRSEVEAGVAFALELSRGRRVVPLGRVAHEAMGGEYVRHPSHGGALAFRRGLQALLAREARTRRRDRPRRAGLVGS